MRDMKVAASGANDKEIKQRFQYITKIGPDLRSLHPSGCSNPPTKALILRH
jgi:hypothetical protein